MTRPKAPENVQCVLFDLDGTLVDSEADISASLREAISIHVAGDVARIDVSPFVGDGARRLVERGLQFFGLPLAMTDHVLESYLEVYGRRLLDNTVLYPAVLETLRELSMRSVRMAVVTNKPVGFSNSLLQGLGVADLLCTVIGGDSLPTKKPDPRPLLEAIARCDAVPERSVMVGDGEADVRAGKAAGVFTVAVSYGFRAIDTLLELGADAAIDSPRELLRVLEID